MVGRPPAARSGAREEIGTGAGPRPQGRRLPRRFFARDARLVAPELVGKLLVCGGRTGRIVEVEAYAGSDDPASHAFGGQTRRNATMFGPPGHLYVYFTYGMHWCANAVCGPAGVASAVLVRALEPIAGIEAMRGARPSARHDRDLCRGPARLCRALGIDGALDGADLVTGDRGVWIRDEGGGSPRPLSQGPRIGISRAVERPWRWWVAGDPNVSRAR